MSEGAKFDPVEAVKMKPKRQPLQAVTPPKEAPSVEKPVVVATPVVLPPQPQKYRVRAERQVVINGCHTFLAAGQIVDPRLWGLTAIGSLRTQGVQLDEIP